MFDVQAILAKTSLVSLVERAGGQPHKEGARWHCPCPLHGGHNPRGFDIYTVGPDERWHCFSGDCGGGDAIDFVQAWQRLDFKGACDFLGAEKHADPQEMARLSIERAERAKSELDAAILKANAARAELQAAELHLIYHANQQGVPLWLERGISEEWQRFWYLGYREDYAYPYNGGEWHTPTLTIPLLDEHRLLLNIKHRLITPQNPKDKYRPERSGLGAQPPFVAIPEMGYDGEWVIVTEGEIKAMVLCSRAHNHDWQFIGVPGRSSFLQTAKKIHGKKIVIIPDPGAEADAIAAAKACGGRILAYPSKIDDYMLHHDLGLDWLHNAVKAARAV